MTETKQARPDIQKVLVAISELEKLPVIQAYLALMESLRNVAEQEG